MTRKDYVLLAKALAASYMKPSPADAESEIGLGIAWGIERAALCIADALAADNPNFDRYRFLKAARGE